MKGQNGNAVNMLDILPQAPSDRLEFGNLDPGGVIKNGTLKQLESKHLNFKIKLLRSKTLFCLRVAMCLRVQNSKTLIYCLMH